MKKCLLGLLMCLSTCLLRAQSLTDPSSAQTSSVYDMLQWMTMSSDLAAAHHMTGSANPIYTRVESNRFFWTKSAQGLPWDVQLYDNNYIYLWVTEHDWRDPRSYKVFHSARLGNFNLPISPRFVHAGYPASAITISDSTYQIHSDCNTYVTRNLGHVVNEVWGPYKENFGGDLPDNLTTMVISYRYTCDSRYANCKNKEEYHFAQPYGLVKWQHEALRTNGTYAAPDKVTIFNRLEAGQTQPLTPCF